MGSYLGQIVKNFLQHEILPWELYLNSQIQLMQFLDQLSGRNHIHPILKCCFINFMQSLSNSNNNKLIHLYNVITTNNHQVVSILLGSHVNIMLNPVTSNNVICSLKWTKFMWKSQRILVMISGKSILWINS